jgi:hypothetical protein
MWGAFMKKSKAALSTPCQKSSGSIAPQNPVKSQSNRPAEPRYRPIAQPFPKEGTFFFKIHPCQNYQFQSYQ